MIYIFGHKNWPRCSFDHAISEIGQINTFGSDISMRSSLVHKENEEKFKIDSILFSNYLEKKPSRVRWKWLELKRTMKSWIWDGLVIINVGISMDIDGYQSVGTKMLKVHIFISNLQSISKWFLEKIPSMEIQFFGLQRPLGGKILLL